MKQVHIVSAFGLAACTLVLCTACVGGSSPSSTAGSTTPSSHTSASTSTTTSEATATQAAAGSTTGNGSTGNGNGGNNNGSTSSSTLNNNGSSGASTCLVRYLNGSVGASQGTAGSTYVDLVFKNLNNQPCTLDGYPGVSFGAGTPVQQLGQPADRNPQATPQKVTLQPGGYAYAVLQIGDAGNYPAATCQPASTTYLQVYPPNTTNQLYVAYDSTGCKGNVVTLHVEAVQPGTGS
jgi:hypothetical protein